MTTGKVSSKTTSAFAAPRKTPEQKANEIRLEFIRALREAGVVSYQSKEFSVTVFPSESIDTQQTPGETPSVPDVSPTPEQDESEDEGHDPLADEDAAIDAMVNPRG